MTPRQRKVEAAFWLGVAQKVDVKADGYGEFLCWHVPQGPRRTAMRLFRPGVTRLDDYPWWNGVDYGDSHAYALGDPHARTIAALLLAAMAEAGDLDWAAQ